MYSNKYLNPFLSKQVALLKRKRNGLNFLVSTEIWVFDTLMMKGANSVLSIPQSVLVSFC